MSHLRLPVGLGSATLLPDAQCLILASICLCRKVCRRGSQDATPAFPHSALCETHAMTEQHNTKSPSSTLDDKSCKAPSTRRRSRRREDNSEPSFSFIHFTGEASFRPGRAQKAVRAQAARASSDRRLATIERRREATRANSADSRALLKTASDGVHDNQLSPLSQNSLSPLTRARSAPPTLPRDGLPSGLAARGSLTIADDWTCDLSGIVQHKLLATTSSDHQQRPAMSRAIIVLLRHKLIVAVQAIIQADVEAKKVLASVVALLAGWEAVSEYILRVDGVADG
ncbi:hypothetical protein M409DRAFT_51839 [Zasmidium cellare ATCC 36951]|uniref:Uncharacterized protein n=1 Tax=Zasmidium cellare ATCC 36951 TaxID=1080233 RepID=A0A6A6CW81_ZASCE|nr:uncharacterized protein M409DRAFT_51839 [Zasmidium cellare ATCC 36951]KAF2170072.1 hypothetical protein M409DRAFT_51839 [Zasmidium cellare ATCC 36951]